jgi:hypothetical protein
MSFKDIHENGNAGHNNVPLLAEERSRREPPQSAPLHSGHALKLHTQPSGVACICRQGPALAVPAASQQQHNIRVPGMHLWYAPQDLFCRADDTIT